MDPGMKTWNLALETINKIDNKYFENSILIDDDEISSIDNSGMK